MSGKHFVRVKMWKDLFVMSFMSPQSYALHLMIDHALKQTKNALVSELFDVKFHFTLV